MIPPYFDLNTLCLYIGVGLFSIYFIHLSIKFPNRKSSLIILFVFLLIFSISRKVDIYLGGMDSISYEKIFMNRDYIRILENREYLFVIFTDFIRSITSNAVIYRFFCYSLIILSYVYFIKCFCSPQASSIPYLLLMYPLLMSFNTMRNSMAMAMILIGLCFMKRNHDFWGIMFVISSVFFHRASIIFLPLILFYYYLRNKNITITKLRFSIAIVCTVLLSSTIGAILKGHVLSSGIIEGTDTYYVSVNEGKHFWNSLAFFIPLLLISMMMVLNTSTQLLERYKFLYIIVFYDIVIYPCTFIFGIWRANEYLYVPRLTLWAILLYLFINKWPCKFRIILKFIFLIVFVIWFIDRVDGIYESSALMPYVLNWFE